MVDLHMHTTVSDGAHTARELILRAKEIGLSAISITDHDTMKAYSEPGLFEFAKECRVELITGIEISTRDDDGNKYHILGYNLSTEDEDLLGLLQKIEKSRTEYTEKVVDTLRALRFDIDETELVVDGGTITKAHIARSVVKHPHNRERLSLELGENFTEGAFIEKYLLPGQEAFVLPGYSCTTLRAVEAIHGAGGAVIVAHPAFNIIKGQDFSEMCERLESLGIDGYEAINIQFDKSNNDIEVDMVKDFSERATKKGLIITGGSDYHSSDSLMGNIVELGMVNTKYQVEDSIIEKLKNTALRYHADI